MEKETEKEKENCTRNNKRRARERKIRGLEVELMNS
uniref:Uncharacterized protein MANES_12G103100 n=1 Tax=Rhizophora mucronata TaxID=61149 RepID=A0A2P2JUB5_RHIMU